MTLSDEQKQHFMELAVQTALAGLDRNEGGPFGAVVVSGGVVVGTGRNEVVGLNDPTAHAEIRAIRDACQRLSRYSLAGCVIFASCEPCPMCLASCYWARLDAIYYASTRDDAARAGFDDATIYDDLARPPEKRALRSERFAGDLGQALFEAWQAKGDRVLY